MEALVRPYGITAGAKNRSHCTGYLPAEHIETPTERLARLNKHRNVDVSETNLALSGESLTYVAFCDDAW